MTIDVTISDADISRMSEQVQAEIWKVKSNVQLAMAVEYDRLVHANLGEFGEDRPSVWPPLSNRWPFYYATKVGRSFATLVETGALEAGIHIDNSNLEFGRVFISDDEVPYATIHQYGGFTPEGYPMPARPYFPMDPAGNPTPHAMGCVTNAAFTALQEELG